MGGRDYILSQGGQCTSANLQIVCARLRIVEASTATIPREAVANRDWLRVAVQPSGSCLRGGESLPIASQPEQAAWPSSTARQLNLSRNGRDLAKHQRICDTFHNGAITPPLSPSPLGSISQRM